MAINVFDLGSSQNGSGATLTLSNLTVPANALIFVLVDEDSGTVASTGLTDSASNTYTGVLAGGNNNNAASNGYSILFYVANAAALNSGTLTFTKGVSGSKCAMAAFYATGVRRNSPFISSFNASATGPAIVAPSVTSNVGLQGGELVVGCLGWTSSDATGANGADGFTQDSSNGAFAFPPDAITTGNNVVGSGGAAVGGGWIINSGTGAITYAPTINERPWSMQIAAFLPEINPGWMGDSRDQTELIRAMNVPVMVPY